MTARSQRTDPPAAPDAAYFAVHRVLSVLVRLLMHYEIEGRENFPSGGPFLVTPNHLALLDAVIAFIAVPVRMVGLGADKWRRSPFFRFVLELMGVIWVARGEADMDAIKAALGVLKRGGRMGVAPEGTRSPTGQLQRGKPGAAFLADRARVPVVPMGITGTENIVRSWRRLQRPLVRCRVGEPYLLPGSGHAKGTELDALTDLVMCKIAILLPAEYRGVYADHPLVRTLMASASGTASARRAASGNDAAARGSAPQQTAGAEPSPSSSD